MKVVIRGVLVGALLLIAMGAMPASAAPAGLRISKRGLNFGAVGFGNPSATSKPYPVTILNKGPAITGLNLQVTPGNLGFQISGKDCKSDLAAGASCRVMLTFTPAFPKRRIATFMVADDSDPSAGAVKLVGTGLPEITPMATPSALMFGAMQVGQKSAQKVKVSNPNKVAVSIQSIATSSTVRAF